jgi:8-oxo-dGTP pyrophosphatase MutT (NUDIX family)
MKPKVKQLGLAVPVVLGAVISRKRLLLIKRNYLPFVGLWGMPGGKIHFGEHLDQAIIREILEECNIKTKWIKLCGVVTETLYLNKNTKLHYLLHICKVKPINFEIKSSIEGNVQWFSLENIFRLKQIMIPSDFIMFKKLVLTEPKKFYYRCEVENSNNRYIVKFFR